MIEKRILEYFSTFFSQISSDNRKIKVTTLLEFLKGEHIEELCEKEYISKEDNWECGECSSKIKLPDPRCPKCGKIQRRVNNSFLYTTDKFQTQIFDTIASVLHRMEWEHRENGIFSRNERKIKIVFKDADLTEREFFADVGESLTKQTYWLIFFCSNSSSFLEAWAETIGITVKIIHALDIPKTLNNLNDFLSDLLIQKPKRSILREAFMYELLKKEIKHSETLITQVLEELDLYTVSDLLMYSIQSESIKSFEGSSQKVGTTFDHIFGALFASYINPDCASIGGGGNPDVITVFSYPSTDKKSELMYFSLKTSKNNLSVSKKDIDEVSDHLRKLIEAESTNLRHYSISYLVFLKPSFKNEKNLITYSKQIRKRISREIQIYYISPQVIAQYIIQLKKVGRDSCIVVPIDFLNFLKESTSPLITETKTVDNFFNSLKKKRKSHLEEVIRSTMNE